MPEFLYTFMNKFSLHKAQMFASVYHYIRYKFKYIIDKRDQQLVKTFCKNIGPVIRETENFYAKYNSTSISLNERKEKGLLENLSLTYGETPWEACVQILGDLEISRQDVFYDLGCGSGRLVFLINRKFGSKSIGIDLIENFIKISNIVCQNLDLKKIKFINADFLKKDLSDGTIFYITATCFEPELLEKISHKLKEIPLQAKVIIITRQLECEHLKLYLTKKYNFGWAKDTAYFYERV
jgi:SAM-dependent methyltransferase